MEVTHDLIWAILYTSLFGKRDTSVGEYQCESKPELWYTFVTCRPPILKPTIVTDKSIANGPMAFGRIFGDCRYWNESFENLTQNYYGSRQFAKTGEIVL